MGRVQGAGVGGTPVWGWGWGRLPGRGDDRKLGPERWGFKLRRGCEGREGVTSCFWGIAAPFASWVHTESVQAKLGGSSESTWPLEDIRRGGSSWTILKADIA